MPAQQETSFIPEEKYRALAQSYYLNTMLGPIVCHTVPMKSEQERKLHEQVIEIDAAIANIFGETWQDDFPRHAINNFGLSIIEDQISRQPTQDAINHLLRLGFILGSPEQIDLFHTDIVSWLETQSIYGYELDSMETAPGESADDYNQTESINNRLIAICHFGAMLREPIFEIQPPSLLASNPQEDIRPSAFDDFLNGNLFNDDES